MGFFDLFKRDPAKAAAKKALKAAQERRRARGPLSTARGKAMTGGRLQGYERLEKIITVKAGKFPWGALEARQAAEQEGLNPAHIDAYMRSEAARRLL